MVFQTELYFHCCFGVPDFALNFLSKDPISVPIELFLFVDCSFVSFVSGFHKLSNPRSNVGTGRDCQACLRIDG